LNSQVKCDTAGRLDAAPICGNLLTGSPREDVEEEERLMICGQIRCRILGWLFAAAVLSAGCYRVAPSEKAATSAPSTPRAVSGTKEDGSHDLPPENLLSKVAAGWAWDPSRPDAPISVDIYDGDKLIRTVLADKFSEPLAKNGIGNGKHGFVFIYPPEMHDGKEHTIRVRISGSNIDLRQTPRTVVIPAGTPDAGKASTKKAS
jgi:hypothetical protein